MIVIKLNHIYVERLCRFFLSDDIERVIFIEPSILTVTPLSILLS